MNDQQFAQKVDRTLDIALRHQELMGQAGYENQVFGTGLDGVVNDYLSQRGNYIAQLEQSKVAADKKGELIEQFDEKYKERLIAARAGKLNPQEGINPEDMQHAAIHTVGTAAMGGGIESLWTGMASMGQSLIMKLTPVRKFINTAKTVLFSGFKTSWKEASAETDHLFAVNNTAVAFGEKGGDISKAFYETTEADFNAIENGLEVQRQRIASAPSQPEQTQNEPEQGNSADLSNTAPGNDNQSLNVDNLNNYNLTITSSAPAVVVTNSDPTFWRTAVDRIKNEGYVAQLPAGIGSRLDALDGVADDHKLDIYNALRHADSMVEGTKGDGKVDANELRALMNTIMPDRGQGNQYIPDEAFEGNLTMQHLKEKSPFDVENQLLPALQQLGANVVFTEKDGQQIFDHIVITGGEEVQTGTTVSPTDNGAPRPTDEPGRTQ